MPGAESAWIAAMPISRQRPVRMLCRPARERHADNRNEFAGCRECASPTLRCRRCWSGLTPDSQWRNPHIDQRERLVLICDHGYSSSLAAATLAELGCQAADVVGGFDAWVDANLPIIRIR